MNRISLKEELENNEMTIEKKKVGKKGKRKGKSKNYMLPLEAMQNRQTIQWTEEADQKLFKLYKAKGSCWSVIATEFPGLTENQVKNRFYSTLRRLATKKAMENPIGEQHPKTKKKDLIAFVDDAILYGHNCSSKRGRKRKLKLISTNDNPVEENKDCNYQNIEEEFSEEESIIEESVNKAYDEEPPKNKFSEILDNKQIHNEVKDLKDESIKEDLVQSEDVQFYNKEESKLSIEIISHNNNYTQNQSLEYGMMDKNYIELLVNKNDDILNMYEEFTRSETMDIEELLELERKMERRLQETQEIISPLRTKVASY